MIPASRQASRTHSYTISSQILNPHFRNTFLNQKKMVKKKVTQEQTLHFPAVPLSVKHVFGIQPKNYRTTLYDRKLNPNLHFRNTLLAAFLTKKEYYGNEGLGSSDFIHFYAILYTFI